MQPPSSAKPRPSPRPRASVPPRDAGRPPSASARGGGSTLLLAAGAAVAAGLAAWAMKPRPPSGEASAGPRYAWRQTPGLVGSAVTIAAPPERLYEIWRRFADFDRFMPDVVQVRALGDGDTPDEAEWTVKGPANASFHFTSRVTEDVPGERIAWEATGSPARHSGSVSFEPTARGTKVTLVMDFDPPGGAVGMAAARLVGMATAQDPRRIARQALKQLKMLVETGEIARTDSAPAEEIMA